MDARRLWQKSFPVRRALLAAFLALHLLAISLNNLPWSPLVSALFDTYRPYLGITGTVQDGWSMYGAVHRTDNHFRLVGTTDDDETVSLAFPGQTRTGVVAYRLRDFLQEREGGFLESLGYGAPDAVYRAFGRYLCRMNPRMKSVRMDMISAEIPPLLEWRRPLVPADYEATVTFASDCPRDA